MKSRVVRYVDDLFHMMRLKLRSGEAGKLTYWPGLRKRKGQQCMPRHARAAPHFMVSQHSWRRPFASNDIVRAMPLVAKVHDRTSFDMLVAVAELALIAVSSATESAKREAGPRELATQAHVEGDIARVRVHVQPEIFALLVLHLSERRRTRRAHADAGPLRTCVVIEPKPGSPVGSNICGWRTMKEWW